MTETNEMKKFTVYTSKGSPYMILDILNGKRQKSRRLLKYKSIHENRLGAILSNQIPKDRRKERFQISETLKRKLEKRSNS